MNRTTHFRLAFLAVASLVAALLVSGPVSADAVENATGSSFGVHLQGPVPLGPQPTAEASVPPGPDAHAEDSVLEVPADPAATSFTAHVEADASIESTIDATLQATHEANAQGTLPTKWNARGYAITEDLEALADNLTADVIEAEAVAACVGDEVVLSTAARIANLSVAGTAVPVFNPGPNEVVFDQGGIKIVAYETNSDGAGGTTDDAETVFVNALHITAPGGIDLVVSHAEASATCAEEDEDLNECEDGIDNDGDGEIDFPNDPGCDNPKDDDESDDPKECEDGIDNDGDGQIDYPDDLGCDSPEDDDESDDPKECEDGIDNDGDGKIDYPDDPGCVSRDDDDETDPAEAPPADPIDAQPSFTG